MMIMDGLKMCIGEGFHCILTPEANPIQLLCTIKKVSYTDQQTSD